MTKEKQTVAEKLARVQTAIDEGALAKHTVVGAMNPDDKTPSSWGPAMRR